MLHWKRHSDCDENDDGDIERARGRATAAKESVALSPRRFARRSVNQTHSRTQPKSGASDDDVVDTSSPAILHRDNAACASAHRANAVRSCWSVCVHVCGCVLSSPPSRTSLAGPRAPQRECHLIVWKSPSRRRTHINPNHWQYVLYAAAPKSRISPNVGRGIWLN